MIGTLLDGRYLITRRIGEGGMGSVYEAQHTGMGRRVAVKVITHRFSENPSVQARFQREARAAGSIDSAHIAQVIDAGKDADTGLLYLVMELLGGEDLSQLLARTGPLAPDAALRVAAHACLALQKAHGARVMHRDIKPANLFLARRDEGEIGVKLLDFGVAKIMLDDSPAGDVDLTRTNHLLGSPLYMSPEQARGLKDIDARTDLWSLGVVLYKMLCGRTPRDDIDALGDFICSVCSTPPPPVQSFAPWVAPEVAAVVHRALRVNRAERFVSAAEMLDALRRLLPNGHALFERDLVAAPRALRAVVALRLETSEPGATSTPVPQGPAIPWTLPPPADAPRPGPDAPTPATAQCIRPARSPLPSGLGADRSALPARPGSYPEAGVPIVVAPPRGVLSSDPDGPRPASAARRLAAARPGSSPAFAGSASAEGLDLPGVMDATLAAAQTSIDLSPTGAPPAHGHAETAPRPRWRAPLALLAAVVVGLFVVALAWGMLLRDPPTMAAAYGKRAAPAAPPVAAAVIDPEQLTSFGALPSAPPSPDTPLHEKKVRLGKMLFFDPRLSMGQDISCNACHDLQRYGVGGGSVSSRQAEIAPARDTLSVYNTAGHVSLFWDGRAEDLEEQAVTPLLSPSEMGTTERRLEATLRSMPGYVRAFVEAFPDEPQPVSLANTANAIAAFERTLFTPGRWDAYLLGDKSALSGEEAAGFNAFVETGCVTCHFGPYVGATTLQKVGLLKAWPNTRDRGRFEVTRRDVDYMVFRVPSLRNVAVTAPYFHDASASTLDEAIRRMAWHQLGKELPAATVSSIAAWLGALTGEIPRDRVAAPLLPEAGPATPAPPAAPRDAAKPASRDAAKPASRDAAKPASRDAAKPVLGGAAEPPL